MKLKLPPVEGVNEVFRVFYDSGINEAINFGNMTSRNAAEWLINKYGKEKAIQIATIACQVQGEQYAPTITTPYQLKEKLAMLMIYLQKNNKVVIVGKVR